MRGDVNLTHAREERYEATHGPLRAVAPRRWGGSWTAASSKPVVLILPKRLRAYFLRDRRRLGLLKPGALPHAARLPPGGA